MRREKLLFSLFLVVSVIVHAALLARIDGAESVVVPEKSEIEITLLAPVAEPPVEKSEPEEVTVTPAPVLPMFAEPMEEFLPIPEEALPPIDPHHEIAQTAFEPSPVTTTPPVVRGNVSNEEIVRGWLQRHKRYPRVAIIRRIEGSVMLYLRLDSAGHILASEIRESSGEKLLDDAVLEMAKSANPFPLVSGNSYVETEYIVPIDFQLE